MKRFIAAVMLFAFSFPATADCVVVFKNGTASVEARKGACRSGDPLYIASRDGGEMLQASERFCASGTRTEGSPKEPESLQADEWRCFYSGFDRWPGTFTSNGIPYLKKK